MLKSLRKKKTAKRIWIILTILILPAFVFWGFGSFIRSKQEITYAGKIFGKKVSLLEYKDALEAVKNQAIIQFGDNFSEIEKKINLESLVWDRLVLLAEAKKRKIDVTDREVIELIKSYPFFQRKGQFDNQIYSQMLQYVFRAQPRIFEEQTRQSLMLSKLYKEVTGNLNLTEEEIKKEYQKLNEQMNLCYIAGLPSDFIKDIAGSEEEIKDYFIKNSLQFKQPLSFNIEYVSLASEDKNEAPIKAQIKLLALRLTKKEDFAKAAGELNLQPKETGLFNQTDPVPGIGWSPQISVLISKLKIGEFAPPIYMDKYYYVLRLKERRESHIPDFSVIKDRVKEVFIKEKARKTAQQKIEDCLKELKTAYKTNSKTLDFDKIAKIYGLKSDSTGLFRYGSYIEGIGASDNFFTAAVDLKEDDTGGIIEMPSGFYIIKLKSKIPVDEKKFREEKPEFAKKLLLQKKEEYFSRFLQDLKRKAQLF
jgi:parvulin-like peptidyl-prolyl isomerase